MTTRTTTTVELDDANCLGCGYALRGLEPRCPECGRSFNGADFMSVDGSQRRALLLQRELDGKRLSRLSSTVWVAVLIGLVTIAGALLSSESAVGMIGPALGLA